MENIEHNVSTYLVKTAELLKLRGCRTVADLLESGPLPNDPFDRAKTLLKMLRSFDYADLQFLAELVGDPRALMDDESPF